jgi:PPOX class probable F420-dependent enzyme
VLPDDVVEFLTHPHHAVLGWLGRDGRPLTAATWYDWDDGQVLLNMDAGRKRLPSLTPGARVSLTVLDAANWYRHVSLMGSIARVAPDTTLSDIDRLSVRYSGAPYASRGPRVSAWMEIDGWHGWISGEPWPRT